MLTFPSLAARLTPHVAWLVPSRVPSLPVSKRVQVDKKKRGVTNSLAAYEGIIPDAPGDVFTQRKVRHCGNGNGSGSTVAVPPLRLPADTYNTLRLKHPTLLPLPPPKFSVFSSLRGACVVWVGQGQGGGRKGASCRGTCRQAPRRHRQDWAGRQREKGLGEKVNAVGWKAGSIVVRHGKKVSKCTNKSWNHVQQNKATAAHHITSAWTR